MPVREVKQFHFLKWPDHGVPNYATALLHFRKRVHLYHPLKRGPMIVHCRYTHSGRWVNAGVPTVGDGLMQVSVLGDGLMQVSVVGVGLMQAVGE